MKLLRRRVRIRHRHPTAFLWPAGLPLAFSFDRPFVECVTLLPGGKCPLQEDLWWDNPIEASRWQTRAAIYKHQAAHCRCVGGNAVPML